MAGITGNNARLALARGELNLITASLKVALMQVGFIYNPNTQINYTDVESQELPTGNGYEKGGASTSYADSAIEPTLNRARINYTDVSWPAVGGTIGPTNSAILYVVDTGLIIAQLTASQVASQVDGGVMVLRGIRVVI